MPKSSIDVSTNTADAHFAGAPCASTMSTMPAAIVTGNVPAWIQPRHLGLTSAGCAMESSSRGMFGRSGPCSPRATEASAGSSGATGRDSSSATSATSAGSWRRLGVMQTA